jgi:hypothetical protein
MRFEETCVEVFLFRDTKLNLASVVSSLQSFLITNAGLENLEETGGSVFPVNKEA